MLLVDTDVMVDILREHPPAVEWLGSVGEENIQISGFVAAELIQGCADKEQQAKVSGILRGYEKLWPSPETCDKAFDVFCQFYLSHSLGVIDALIGQTAVDMGSPLQSFNKKHYECIPGLTVEEPYERHTTSG